MARKSQDSSAADLKWVYLAEPEARRHPEYGLGGWLGVFQLCLWAGIVAGGVALVFLYDQPKFFRYEPYYLLAVCASIQAALVVFLAILFYFRFPSINLAVFLFALVTLVVTGLLYRDVQQFRSLVCLDDNAAGCSAYLVDQAALDRVFDAGILAEIGIFVLAGFWGLFFAQSRQVAITFQHRMRPNDPFATGGGGTSATITGPVSGSVAGGLAFPANPASSLVASAMVLEPERGDMIANLRARIAYLEQIVHREGDGLIAAMVEPPVPCTEPGFAKSAQRQNTRRSAPGVPQTGLLETAAPPAVALPPTVQPAAADGAGNDVQYPSDPPLTLPPHIVSSVETLGDSGLARRTAGEDSMPRGWADDLIEEGNLAYDRNYRSTGGAGPSGPGAHRPASGDDAIRSRLTRVEGAEKPLSPRPIPTASAAKPSPSKVRVDGQTAAAAGPPGKPVARPSDPSGSGKKIGETGLAPLSRAASAAPSTKGHERPPFAPKPVAREPQDKAKPMGPVETPTAPDRGKTPAPARKPDQEPETKSGSGDQAAQRAKAEPRTESLPDNVAEHPSARQASHRRSLVDGAAAQPGPAGKTEATSQPPANPELPPAQPGKPPQPAEQPTSARPDNRDRLPGRKDDRPVRIRPRSRIRKEDLPPVLQKHAPPPEDPNGAAGDAVAGKPQATGTFAPATPADGERATGGRSATGSGSPAGPRPVFRVEDGVGRVSSTWDGVTEIAHKECPSCAERIRIRAKHCRHCNHTYFASQFDEEQEAFARLVGDSPVPAAARAIQSLRSQIVDVLTGIGVDLEVYQASSGDFQLRSRGGKVLHSVAAQNRPALEQMRDEIITIKGLLYEIAESIDDGRSMKDGLAHIDHEQDIAEMPLIDGVKLGDCRKMLELLGQLVR